MGLSQPLLIGNLARLGPTSGSRSPYRVWPKMTQRFGRSTLVNWWGCCRRVAKLASLWERINTMKTFSPNSHNIHFLSACSVCLLDILQLLKLTVFCVKILITKSKSKYLHIFLFKQFLSILKEGSSSLQEVDQNASVPPNLKKTNWPRLNSHCQLTNHVVAPSTISEAKPAVASGFFLCWPKASLTGEKT